LHVCDACGEARGTTPKGQVSACFCSGDECTWCGTVIRRPITDYYDHRSGEWIHVPYFNELTHRCEAPPELRVGRQWRARPPDPDVRTYQEAMTELAWSLLEDRAGD
ncbi:MAG TPA: hypothetical protein VFV72_09275, partial [Candidatus Limnocylindrales bacterium]|nr:hypothetical protein [Candidatus Limnocylindrales bacterium]